MNIERLIEERVKTDWKNVLKYVVSDYKDDINRLISEQKEKYGNDSIMPIDDNIFRCFNYFNIIDTKVIILGQDPYSTHGVADGLCFSHNVYNYKKLQPSVKNIFKELSRTHNILRENGNLDDWACQGVLLMNTSLTVLVGKPQSHVKIWKKFMVSLLKWMSENLKGVCIMLWGNDAKNAGKEFIGTDNLILVHTHPSPLSRVSFIGCDHFRRCDEYLGEDKKINWIE